MEAYDYVIAGGGTAGCVLANRLTEDRNVSVLLLEAGGSDRRMEVQTPAAFPKLFWTDADWAYETMPEKNMGARRMFWPRGKMLGGCSSINAMIYIRGHASDYDGWAALGNEGWGFRDVLPYFKRSESWHGTESLVHGYGGPLHVQRLKEMTPISEVFLRGATEAGLSINEDFNGPIQDGVGVYQTNIHKGRRWSAADAYLHPATRRKNLTVAPGAHATRILFEGRYAKGLEFLRDNKLVRAEVRREVIVCGGAIGSPQLLLQSGVGPAADLRALDLPVVLDLPGVGENLQDHLMGMLSYACREPHVTLDGAETFANIVRYMLFKTGPFSSNIGEVGGFVRTRPGIEAPDLQLIFGPAFYIAHGTTKPGGDGFSIGYILLRPESRGRISLAKSDPAAHPRIEANYLDTPGDLATMLSGFKLARKIAHAPAFNHYRGAEYAPGDSVQEDDGMIEHLRETSETVYHPVGTCKMGRDPMAVVDSRLRVRGVDGVRVVDASVMPTIPGGNTHAPVLMIAEKAADMIKASYR